MNNEAFFSFSCGAAGRFQCCNDGGLAGCGPGAGIGGEQADQRAGAAGCYERINFTPAMMQEMNKTEYWPQPYQYFCFLPDGTFASMMSDKPRRGSAESLRQTLEVLPQVFTYGFQSGFIVIQSVDGRESTVWDAMILLEDSNTVDGTPTPKGTLVMGMLSPNADEIEYWRYLKPLH